MNPPEVLYHYTTASVLQSIVEKRRIWASSVAFLNDSTEVLHAVRRAAKRWEKKYGNKYNRVVEVAEDWIGGVFVCSFSEDRDDLAQWRAYGRQSGVCIGFHASALQAAVPTDYLIEEPIQMCEYDDSVMDMRLDELGEFMAELSEEDLKRDDLPDTFGEDLLALAARFKSSGFKSEHEWRAVLHRFAWKDGSLAAGMHISRGLLVPHLEIPFNNEDRWIESVTVGPAPSPDLAVTGVRELMRLYKVPVPQERIRSSTIPYRDW